MAETPLPAPPPIAARPASASGTARWQPAETPLSSHDEDAADALSEAPGFAGKARLIALPLAILLALALGVGMTSGLRDLLGMALERMRLAPVLAVLPLQALAIGVCSVALWWLGPGVSLRASFISRLLRDAGNNMLLILPGLGEAIGARALVLAGARPRAAVSVRALDIVAETLGQLPYMALALVVLTRVWRRLGIAQMHLPAMVLPGISALATGLGVALVAGLAALAAEAWRGRGRPGHWSRRLLAEARLVLVELRRRGRALPLATALHILAWGLSGLQIWVAARLFGLPLGLGGAIAVESAASALRVILFFVPGGLVMQEAGAVAAGLAFGLAPAESLALALVLRVRDLVFGLALLGWPVMEWRAKRKKV